MPCPLCTAITPTPDDYLRHVGLVHGHDPTARIFLFFAEYLRALELDVGDAPDETTVDAHDLAPRADPVVPSRPEGP